MEGKGVTTGHHSVDANDDAIAALFDGIAPLTLLIQIADDSADDDELQALFRDGVVSSYSAEASASRSRSRHDDDSNNELKLKLKLSPCGRLISAGGEDVVASHQQAVDTATVKRSAAAVTVAGTSVSQRPRKRPREELAHLRERIDELERELATRQRENIAAAGGSEREQHGSQSLRSPWERRARDQMRGAKRAREENEALRRAVRDQLKTIKTLQKLLSNRPSISQSPLRFSQDAFFCKRSSFELRRGLFGALRNQPTRVDRMLSDAGLANCVTDLHRVRVGVACNDIPGSNSSALCIEVSEAHVFPFSVDETSRTIWDFFSRSSQSMYSGKFKDFEADGGEIFGSYDVECPWNGAPHKLAGVVAMQRGQEEEEEEELHGVNSKSHHRRTVHRWESLSAFSSLDGKQSENNKPVVLLRESGWSTLESLTVDASSGSVPVAMLKFGLRITLSLPEDTGDDVAPVDDCHCYGCQAELFPSSPQKKKMVCLLEDGGTADRTRATIEYADAKQDPSLAPTLSEFAISARERDMSLFYRNIENMLMDQRLRKQRVTEAQQG